MPVTAETWLLQPSRRQRWLDAAFMAVTLGLLWPLLSLAELAALALVWGSLWWWRQRRHWQRAYLHHDGSGWWLEAGGQRQPLVWRTGSSRRAGLISWRYGVWPWQRLLIRADSLPAADFQRLLKALYLP
ncbi:hypothetical protein GJQ54_10310 [Oceanospirillaceae bacterium ASx5O]|nr:hypothetical protein GJQ54_10310 [Oceanospirillaceae bacterium ASx5O]